MFVEVILNEQWKPLDFPGVVKDTYMISDHGRVYTKLKKRIMKDYLNGHGPGLGYPCTTLMGEDGKAKKLLKHRITAWHFVEGYSEEKNRVNHKDGVKLNNYYKNLEWVTQKENIQHAFRTGLNTNPGHEHCAGENHANAKYPDSMIERICELSQNEYKPKKIYTILQKEYPELIDGWKSMQVYINAIRMRQIRTDISQKYTHLAPQRRKVS